MNRLSREVGSLLAVAVVGLTAAVAAVSRADEAAGAGKTEPPPAVATAAAPATAAPAQTPAAPAEAGKEGETELKAEHMEMDFKAGHAVFTGNVRVSDATMTLYADRMAIDFTEDNQLKRVEATGNVIIVQPDKQRKATAGHAVYDATLGTITLDDKPRLQMEKHSMEGADRIVYSRDSEKVTTEGQGTVIRVITDGLQNPADLLGERKKNGGN